MEKKLKILSISLWAGSFWDWGASILIIFFPSTVLLFGVPYPQEIMYFRFAGLLLFILPFFYIQAALKPEKERGIIIGSIIARFSGFIFLSIHYLFFSAKFLFFFFGIVDLIFGLWHLLFFIPIERRKK
jgi:hypothetical protein